MLMSAPGLYMPLIFVDAMPCACSSRTMARSVRLPLSRDRLPFISPVAAVGQIAPLGNR